MLSIQYVYERILQSFSFQVSRLMFLLKAAAKVQLLFNLTSFFKKISFFIFASSNKPQPCNDLPFLAVGVAKITSFPFIKQAFFYLFF